MAPDRWAESLGRIALGHVTRPFPHKLDHVLTGPDEEASSPELLHPLFYGSFDWHSCVHGYWTLSRLLARHPELSSRGEIRALFDAQITPENVARERAYFERPSSRGFERPYGWAWLLKLASELHRSGASGWFDTLLPLTDLIRGRFAAFLPLATYPVRVGTHFNTAFALLLAADFAAETGDDTFMALLRHTAEHWYGADRNCQAWEPGGDDFLSSALIEAACMQRLLPSDAFADWLGGFLPCLAQGEPSVLFRPALVTDRTDGKLAHLDGLNLSRAWCWRLLSASLSHDDPRKTRALAAADEHLACALPHVAGHYMGEHWLASFALLALEAGEARSGDAAANSRL